MTTEHIRTHFSDYCNLEPQVIEDYGAFNVNLVEDVPLFIDPFLLFNSESKIYRELHDSIIRYIVFLRDKALRGNLRDESLRELCVFSEIRQTWLGFAQEGNRGRGLGMDFAIALRTALTSILASFGSESVTSGSHLEKLCLFRRGVGRDTISDFTTNLIKDHLLDFTERFAADRISDQFVREVAVRRVSFNYDTETWMHKSYRLPFVNGDFVVLTPVDLLTREDTWINRGDFYRNFERIVESLPNDHLRANLNGYLSRVLSQSPTNKEKADAFHRAAGEYPDIVDYFILDKEQHGNEAVAISDEHVALSRRMFVTAARSISSSLATSSTFYQIPGNTRDEALLRLKYLKDIVENKGGYRLFYGDDGPIRREKDLQIVFRTVWFGTPSDLSAEVNDGRGPADFKVSRGAADKTIVEMKLGSNSSLKRNLERQAEVYRVASDAQHAISCVMYFTEHEHRRVMTILADLGLLDNPSVVLIDARRDNKPSGSKA